MDFHSSKSALLINPKLPLQQKNWLESLYKKFDRPGHVFIASSGSSAKQNESLKLIALSKMAFLNSAQAVNQHLDVQNLDRWLLALPEFHVGGLSIYARAQLSGLKVFNLPLWSAVKFVELCEQNHVTLTSLVPTQVFDLVQAQIPAPISLRQIVVGGAAIAPQLLDDAKKLGYPLLPSYGMTECCSQVATATKDSLALKILSHCQIEVASGGQIKIRSKSMMTGYCQIQNEQAHWFDQDPNSWFQTSDIGNVKDGYLEIVGRSADFIKVNGEGVNLQKLNQRLVEVAGSYANSVAIQVVSDERSSYRLVLRFEGELLEDQALSLQKKFNAEVAPFERLQEIKFIKKIPRTALGKIIFDREE